MPRKVREIGAGLLGESAISVRSRLDTSPKTLCHGDFRLDNIFFLDSADRGTSEIAVIDWSGLRSGPGLWDISHMVCQGLEPDLRRSCEADFLSAYCQTLAENGVSDYSTDQAWGDYRLSMLTHLQKLARGFASFDLVNDRHRKLREVLNRRVISAVADHCSPAMI